MLPGCLSLDVIKVDKFSIFLRYEHQFVCLITFIDSGIWGSKMNIAALLGICHGQHQIEV